MSTMSTGQYILFWYTDEHLPELEERKKLTSVQTKIKSERWVLK